MPEFIRDQHYRTQFLDLMNLTLFSLIRTGFTIAEERTKLCILEPLENTLDIEMDTSYRMKKHTTQKKMITSTNFE